MRSAVLKGTLVTVLLVLGAGLVFVLAGCAEDPVAGQGPQVAEEPEVRDAVENQKYCPIMTGMEINRDLYVDHDGERVYFCCAGCIGAFQADPETHMATLRELHEDPDAVEPADHQDHDHHHH